MKIVGVDPGKTGAIALLEDGVLKNVFDMPTSIIRVSGKDRPQVDPDGLAELFLKLKPHFVMLEKVGTRPGEGAVGAFTFGRGFGSLEGVLASYNLPRDYVTPAVWKRFFQISSEKNLARLAASEMFPDHAGMFKRIKDDGRAEATLIAVYAYHLMNKK